MIILLYKSESSGVNKDEAESPSTKTERQFDDILSQIKQNVSTLERYEKEYAGACQEDRNILKLQLYKLRMQIIDDVQQLADRFMDLNESATQTERLSEIEYIFSRDASQLWFQIDQLSNEIDSIRAKRPGVDPGSRMGFENQIEKLTENLDQYFERSLSIIQEMEQIGMDTVEVRRKFIALLTERIDNLSGRLDLALARFDEYEAQLKLTPGDAEIIKSLNAAKKSLDTNKNSMNTVLGLMEAMELNTSSYRAQLLTETRDISSGALDTDVALRLLSRS